MCRHSLRISWLPTEKKGGREEKEKEGGKKGRKGGRREREEKEGKLCTSRCRVLAFYSLSPVSTGSQYLGNKSELCTEAKQHLLIPTLPSNSCTNSHTTLHYSHSILSLIPRPSNAWFKVNSNTMCTSPLPTSNVQCVWVRDQFHTRCLSSARSRQTL